MVTVTATDTGGSNRTATQSFRVTVLQPFTRRPDRARGDAGSGPSTSTELRARIDALRSTGGLARFSWTDPVLRPGVTRVRRVHLLELRQALAEAVLGGGAGSPTLDRRVAGAWVDPDPGVGM